MQAIEYIEQINKQLEELKKFTEKTENCVNGKNNEEPTTYSFKLPKAN